MDTKKTNYNNSLLEFIEFQNSISPFFLESSIVKELENINEASSIPDLKELLTQPVVKFPEKPETPEKTIAVEDIDSLEKLCAAVSSCTKCRLAETRKNTVPGEGNPKARLMFIGEGPGADEDESGKPFVGKAGQLLTKIIENGLKIERSDVYICNIVKCRPPMNRDPLPEEAGACLLFVKKQIELIKPEAIILLGRIALKYLLDIEIPMKDAREKEFFYNNIRVFPTYHPSALLRNELLKRPVWEDLKKVITFLNM